VKSARATMPIAQPQCAGYGPLETLPSSRDGSPNVLPDGARRACFRRPKGSEVRSMSGRLLRKRSRGSVVSFK
jgi:hypothetical protein